MSENKSSRLTQILITIFGLLITVYLHNIDEKLNWQKHDLSILQEFQTIYFQDHKRGLSMRYLNLINHDKTKRQARQFVVWDILYRNIAIEDYRKHRTFKFNPSNLDWHWLGENLGAFFAEDKGGIEFYRAAKKQSLIDFEPYAQEDQIKAIFAWVENNYHFERVLNK